MLSKKRGKRSGKIRDLVRGRDICAHKYVLQWRPISPSFTIHFAYRNFLRTARLSKTHRWFSHECARQPDRWLITHRSWQLSINTIFLPLDRSGQRERQNERSGRKQAFEDRSRVSPMQMKSNCLSSIRARACVCACVYVCVRSTRNHQDICTCVRSWTTTKDTRVKTGTKFTLVDTFSATKSRRLRFRGSPPNPNTIGQGMEVLTQEMRSSGVISLRRDGASVVDSEDVSLARSKPFKFPVRVVERWYVVARVRACDVLVMYFRSIEIWIDRPRSASSDRYDFSFHHCSFAWSQ